jgi:hypothetical protein
MRFVHVDLRRESLHALGDLREGGEESVVEGRERQGLPVRKLDEERVVGGDAGFQRASKRSAPKCPANDRMDAELRCVVEPCGRGCRA